MEPERYEEQPRCGANDIQNEEPLFHTGEYKEQPRCGANDIQNEEPLYHTGEYKEINENVNDIQREEPLMTEEYKEGARCVRNEIQEEESLFQTDKYKQFYGPDDKESDIVLLQKEIEKYKEKHSALIKDVSKLKQKKEEAEALAKKFQERAIKDKKKLLERQNLLRDQNQKFQENVGTMWEQNQQLKAKEQNIKEKIDFLGKEREKLEAVCFSGVERKMVFKGKVNDNISRCGINVKHHIRYSVIGGTALIVFEEPLVAAGLIKKKHHRVAIEECYINVKTEPVELTVLDTLTMDMNRSPCKMLVTNLPDKVSEDTLVDKLELFFSKSKNGGGEVENTEYLEDSRSAIVTFVQEGVAPRLIEKKMFDVPFGKQTHQVCVSPSLDGNLTGYQIKRLLCNRTVLITGIPDIKDEDTMADLLQIHFQKESNHGGEVQKLFYCPEGKNAVVLFEDDEDDIPQNE